MSVAGGRAAILPNNPGREERIVVALSAASPCSSHRLRANCEQTKAKTLNTCMPFVTLLFLQRIIEFFMNVKTYDVQLVRRVACRCILSMGVIMRYLALAGSLLAASISLPASAADLGIVYDPVPTYEPSYNQAYNWTGGYVGGHAGWAWDEANFTLETSGFWGTAGDGTSIDSDGFIGGGQIGYWYQPNNLVFGLDVSGSWADLSQTVTSVSFPGTDTWSTEIDWFVLAQARIGVAKGRWLAFLQGGYAGAQASATGSSTFQGPQSASDDQWHNGWTVGGGVAVKANHWLSLGVEYNYVDLGSQTYGLGGCGSCGGGETASVDHQFHLVKGTINVHFNGH